MREEVELKRRPIKYFLPDFRLEFDLQREFVFRQLVSCEDFQIRREIVTNSFSSENLPLKIAESF